MKLQHVLLGHLLLGSGHALSVLDGRDETNSSLSSSGSSITWSECDLDVGESLNAAIDARPEKPECAKLSVPLDYTNLSSGETIELQLVKIGANKEPYKGSVLYNPGGPGGSGVLAVLGNNGLRMRDIVGGHYDIIGFDPRGVGRTIPFSCNVSMPQTLRRRELNPLALPQGDVWRFIKELVWDPAEVTATACLEQQAKYGRFVGTPFVARDMISIADALAQGPKVNFWGASYGSTLGQVFLSMFPERVGRVLLDASLGADDYASTTWVSALRDGERSLYKLYEECVNAGPEYCSLANYSGDNTTADDLRTAVNNALEEKLGDDTEGEGYGVAQVTGVKRALQQQLYYPSKYLGAVERITHVLDGNWTAALMPLPDSTGSEWQKDTHSFLAIACGDSSFRAENVEDLYSMYRAHLEQSQFGEATIDSRFLCARWKFHAAEKIDLNALRSVRTSFPVLLVNGRYDPTTPLGIAWETSARIRNSRVIIHNGVGHGAITHPSNCTNEAIRQYFDEGKMPELGLTCEPEMNAFEYAKSRQK
ncbi:hypothetical protein CMUS01_11443 [Colletotrichum musicola]|uniref:Peptidase S33 tripeptidyl aminopeptidase-like C-terminal domain-containing protein n=1 Tax=Colletotrichum musicola TaxID=2175873 RepID=A0A8H6JXI7_9PEZI|nr:hypothetical protein CMUS01_11443 [Colletotrichum musicola]